MLLRAGAGRLTRDERASRPQTLPKGARRTHMQSGEALLRQARDLLQPAGNTRRSRIASPHSPPRGCLPATWAPRRRRMAKRRRDAEYRESGSSACRGFAA